MDLARFASVRFSRLEYAWSWSEGHGTSRDVCVDTLSVMSNTHTHTRTFSETESLVSYFRHTLHVTQIVVVKIKILSSSYQPRLTDQTIR